MISSKTKTNPNPSMTKLPSNINLANVLSLLRIVLTPVIVWLILIQHYTMALGLFIIAGLSDALDGLAARWLQTKTPLGAYLDPLADKCLVVCVYYTLGSKGLIPLWLMIVVIFRDVMILAGIVFAALFSASPLVIKPIVTSKINTVLQLLLILFILIDKSQIPLDLKSLTWMLNRVIALTTVMSGAMYLRSWLKHMNASAPQGTLSA